MAHKRANTYEGHDHFAEESAVPFWRGLARSVTAPRQRRIVYLHMQASLCVHNGDGESTQGLRV